MRYGSVCSGVAPQTASWAAMGLQCAWFAEIEPFPAAVLKHHYPEIPNLGDFTKIGAEHGPIDLLVGGTPCQSFSVAGLRGGLADDRGNLALEFLRLADRLRPRWLVWENVPGVLSSNGGRDFGSILGGMVELGYGFAYRVLDAQYAGVPQRRRRVFVVGHLGDWRGAAAVLFERHGLSGHPAPRREARQGVTYPVAPCIGASGRGFERTGDTRGQDAVVATFTDIAPTLNAHFGDKQGLEDQHIRGGEVCSSVTSKWAKGSGGPSGDECQNLIVAEAASMGNGGFFDEPTHSLRADGFDASEDGTGRGTPLVPWLPQGYRIQSPDGVADTVTHNPAGGTRINPVLAFSAKDHGADATEEVGPTLRAATGGSSRSYVVQMAVRRLTPRECERLQGMADDYTLVPFRGKPAADGPRYKAIGNSWAVPVLSWIGQRIITVEAEKGSQ